jgi:surface polysaccharide O-acyltransferase-like enzyme
MNRSVGIDIIKVCAVFFVISVHFFANTNYYSLPLKLGENLFFQTFLKWFFLICVPLFMMVTGYLQSNKKLSARYYRGLLPLLGGYFFYSIITILVRGSYFNENKHAVQWIYEILTFTAVPIAWYVNMYIGLFLIIPFLNLIFNNLKSKNQRLVLVFTLILMCGLPSFFNYMPISVYGSKINILYFPNWWQGIYPLAYYFIGCYIKEYKPKINKFLASGLLFVVICAETVLTFYFSHGGPSYIIGEFGSILVMVSTFLFFIILYDIDIKNKIVSITISSIAALTLDIYLSSYLADRFVYQYVMTNIFESNYQIIFYFVPIVGTIFAITLVVSFMRKLITNLIFSLLHQIKKAKDVDQNNAF